MSVFYPKLWTSYLWMLIWLTNVLVDLQTCPTNFSLSQAVYGQVQEFEQIEEKIGISKKLKAQLTKAI